MADAGDKRGAKTKQTGKKNKKQTNIIADVSLQVTPPSNLMTSQINLPPIRPSVALLSQGQSTPPTSQLNPQSNADPIPQQLEPNLLVHSPTGAPHTPGTSSSGIGNDNNNQLWIEPDGDGFLPHKPVIEGIASCIKSKFEEGKPSWKKFSRDTRDMWFEEFKKKFRWAPNHHVHIRENFEKRGASKLTQLLQKARTDGKKSAWIGDSAWTDLMKYWQSSTFRVKSEQNKKNRDSNAGASLHTGGSIPHRVHFKRMKAELGEDPSISEFYFRTHKKKDKNWVHQKAQDAYENFEKKKSEISSQNTTETENNSGDGIEQSQSEMDIWMDRVGGKKKGRVAGLGSLGRTMKSFSSRSSNLYSTTEDVEQIRSSVHSLNASLQAQLERERQEKEEMKKELSETRSTLNYLMEHLGFRPGTSSRPNLSSADKNDESQAHQLQQDKSDEDEEESSDE